MPSSDVPENLEAFPPVSELGGAIGRRASVACQQGQHDLCTDDTCQCRHHERLWYDNPKKYLDEHNGIPPGWPDPWED